MTEHLTEARKRAGWMRLRDGRIGRVHTWASAIITNLLEPLMIFPGQAAKHAFAIEDALKHAGLLTPDTVVHFPMPAPVDPELLARRIDSLDFGKPFHNRILHACQNHFTWEWTDRGVVDVPQPIVTVADLIAIHEHDLLLLNNLGRGSVERIKQVLGAYGLTLGQGN